MSTSKADPVHASIICSGVLGLLTRSTTFERPLKLHHHVHLNLQVVVKSPGRFSVWRFGRVLSREQAQKERVRHTCGVFSDAN